MKRSLILVSILLSFSSVLHSQFQYYVPKDTMSVPVRNFRNHSEGEKLFSISTGVITNRQFGVKMGVGINFQIFLGKRISLDTDLVLGNDYIHGGPGVIAIPFWAVFFTQSEVITESDLGLTGYLIMAGAALLSFEHISYHFPVQNDLEISPYVSLLRFRANPQKEDFGSADQLSFATGAHLNKYFGRFFISPYAEFNIGYKDHIPGLNAGVGMGLVINPR